MGSGATPAKVLGLGGVHGCIFRHPDRTLAKLWWVLLYGYLKYSLRKNENQMRATFFICENRFSAISADFRIFDIFQMLTKIHIFDGLIRSGGDPAWLGGLGPHSSII